MPRIYPRIRLTGNDLLKRIGVIHSQILNDLLMKVDEGGGDYEKGFFHTSTTTLTDPNYYPMMWSRDVGRGLIELARAGLTEDARSAADYILKAGKSVDGDHYGRLIERFSGTHEIDGNVNVLLALYMVWRYGGQDRKTARTYLDNALSVFDWLEGLSAASPYGGLLSSKSELSGNPDTEHFIYALFATYGACVAALAYAALAGICGDSPQQSRLCQFSNRLTDAIKVYLISKGPDGPQHTKTPPGVYLNGIDERTGKAAETGDFGPEFDISAWTRQLPFIQEVDVMEQLIQDGALLEANVNSYDYIKAEMATGYFFRRYGFVSNTCFRGMGGRHDDTMAGYGQNFFTQAALLSDDVNTYTKCLEGIARLAYDGDVVAPMTFDLNPWVMHECFTYENYEQGLDHTFGRIGNETLHIMHNPGDEGNLVQSAETLKSLAIMAGISARGDMLTIKPRFPWECETADIADFPAPRPDGTMARISYRYQMDRVDNAFTLALRGLTGFSQVAVRLGPLPNVLCNEETLAADWTITRKYNASFAERNFPVTGDTLQVSLINQR